jgi:hypothetical protein
MQTPENWPESWKGGTVLNFGLCGKMQCEIVTDSFPSNGHIANFSEIQSRWSTVWPEAERKIKEILEQFGRPTDLKNPLFTMEIQLPTEPIKDGVSWSISAHIHDNY